MANILDVPENFSTTLNVGGGIDASQTTGIVLTAVSGLPTDGGILCFDWANPIDTGVAEYIEYGGIAGNTLTGVVRGSEGFSAHAHTNGCTIVGVISRAHIQRLKDNFTAQHDRSTGAHSTSQIVDLNTAQTLTNKNLSSGTNTFPTTWTGIRITKRITQVTTSTTPTPDVSACDVYELTALASAAAFGAPTGTPTDGQPLVIRVKDNATARALTWDGVYRAGSDIALPSTTVLSKTLYCGFLYNTADTKWDLLAVVNNI